MLRRGGGDATPAPLKNEQGVDRCCNAVAATGGFNRIETEKIHIIAHEQTNHDCGILDEKNYEKIDQPLAS